MEIFYILLLVAFIYFIYWLIKSTNTPLTPEAKKQLTSTKQNKKRTYYTIEFKIPKRINDGDPVKPYSIPNSNAVNFYEKDSYGGEGFLHKEFNKNLWEVIEKNRDISATITRTEKNKAEIKIIYN